MAAAFSPENRIHKPLTSPLEDLHPHLSHLKTRWPVAAHKLAEFTSKSPKRADYSHGRHLSERGDDDLIILNVYGTTDPATSYGIGPSPLTPLYIFNPIPHPADRAHKSSIAMIKSPSSAPSTPLTKADKLVSIFPSPKKPTKPLPGLELLGLQCITERRGVTVERNRDLKIGLEIPLRIDVSSPIAILPGEITMARLSLRWKEEFVEVRLESALEASKLEAKQEKKGGLGVFFHCTALDLDSPPRLPEKVPTTFKDVPACRIYLEPHVTAIGGPQKQNSPLVSLFSTTPRSPTTRTTAGEIVYTTYEEISGAPGIDVFFTSPHKSGKQGFYWFIIEDSSWRLVLQEVTADSTWGRENCSRFDKNFSHKAERFIGEKLRKPAYHPTMGRKRVSSNTEPEKKVRSYVANIYGAIHEEPLISVDMVTGQMWIVEGIQIEMVDVVVAILCAAVNLEKGMNAVVGGGKRRDSWVKEMQGALERIDGSGCI